MNVRRRVVVLILLLAAALLVVPHGEVVDERTRPAHSSVGPQQLAHCAKAVDGDEGRFLQGEELGAYQIEGGVTEVSDAALSGRGRSGAWP